MQNLSKWTTQYLVFCEKQKELNGKTLKAYRIDLSQFTNFIDNKENPLSKGSLEEYCQMLHQSFKPRTVKRKIASAKAFCHWLEYEELIDRTPFAKVQTKYREPKYLPRIIPMKTITEIFQEAYRKQKAANPTSYIYRSVTRDIAILELLFATGLRVSELSNLKSTDLNLRDGSVRVFGKGGKERIVQIGNSEVISALIHYKTVYSCEIQACGYFFVNRRGNRYTEQSVRVMIGKYEKSICSTEHITPHMFRHTMATGLLEAGVDIRYIQEILGHSSISITEIYTHVAGAKQKEILAANHPRNQIEL